MLHGELEIVDAEDDINADEANPTGSPRGGRSEPEYRMVRPLRGSGPVWSAWGSEIGPNDAPAPYYQSTGKAVFGPAMPLRDSDFEAPSGKVPASRS